MDQNSNDGFEMSQTLGVISDATDNSLPPIPGNEEVEMLDVTEGNTQTNNNQPMQNLNNSFDNGMNNFNDNSAAFNSIPNDLNTADIGVVPPIDIKEKEPKKKNKVLFTILVIIFILLIGGGLYYYLSISKGTLSNSVQTKNLSLELGTDLSTDVNDYATFKSISSNNCILDTKSVDIENAGTYEYSITCGNKVYKGNITLADTKAPIVKTKTIVKTVNATIDPKEFIYSCDDASDCTYTFENEETVNNALQNAGTYDINLIVSDSSNNTINTAVKLIIISSDIKVYLNCAKEIEEDSFNGTHTKNFKVGINADTKYAGIYFKIDEYIAANEDTYVDIKNNYTSSNTLSINDGEGMPSFDDTNLTITFEDILSDNEFGSSYSEIRSYYESSTSGYKCNIINVN